MAMCTKGKMMKRKGRKTFSNEMPNMTSISESRTSCDTTMIAQMTTTAERNCGTSSLRK
jgi:hypothetical protein